jgi:hypothetical protein
MSGIVGFSGTSPLPGSTKTLTRDVYTVIFPVGALTASFGDVTVSGLPWAQAGDVFTWNPTTRLAGAGLFDINCATNGSLTGRFFGTTGGGNYVVSVCHTAAP